MSLTGDMVPSAPPGGIVFTGCEMQTRQPAAARRRHAHGHAHPRRREVVVNGKRVKTIDVHAHCCVPKAMALIKHPLEAPGLLMDDTSVRIAAMDAQGIDVEALSINPYWYRAERDVAAELIKVQNETLVEFCAANPDRFVAFATAALQHPELAAEQVEHAVKKLGFRGVGVGGSVARRGAGQSAVPSVLGQVRGAGRPGLHASAGHARARAERPAGRQRPSDQHDRQSAGDHDRAVAPDLRGHARSLSRPEDLRRARRRLPAVLRQPLGRGDPLLPQPRRPAAQEEADGLSEGRPALLRHDRVHARGAAPPDRRDRSPARS